MLGNLQRWLAEGKLTPAILLEPDDQGQPWLVQWLGAKIRKTAAELHKHYESPYDIARLAVALIEQAGAWKQAWMLNTAPVYPAHEDGRQRPMGVADLLLWQSSDAVFAEWKRTAAEAHMAALLSTRLYKNSTPNPPATPLQMAVRKDSRARMAWMLAHGADINGRSPNGQTPVFDAQNVKVLQDLVKKGADLTLLDHQGQRPVEKWINAPNVRSDLMILPFLKTHPQAFTPAILHRAVVVHTLDGHPFGSDNKPSALYRQVKDQLHTPLVVNGTTHTLLGLWAQRALEKKEPERLQWALSLSPPESEVAPGTTDGDLARLAWTMKHAGTFNSDKGTASWEKMTQTYVAALAMPLQNHEPLRALPGQILESLLRGEPSLIHRTLTRLGLEEKNGSPLSQAMRWVAETQEDRAFGANQRIDRHSLHKFLSTHQPPTDTLAPALLLLSRNTDPIREMEEDHPLRQGRWMGPVELATGEWTTPLLWAAWCQNMWMARQSEGQLTSEEWEAMAQCSARLAAAPNGLETLALRWQSRAREAFLDRQLPTASARTERLRF